MPQSVPRTLNREELQVTTPHAGSPEEHVPRHGAVSPLYGCQGVCHTFWVHGRIRVEDVAGSEDASCHDHEECIYAGLERECGRCTHGAGAVLGGLFHHFVSNNKTSLPHTGAVCTAW